MTTYEYTVMVQVGQAPPRPYNQDTYLSYSDAYDELYDIQSRDNEGYTVKDIDTARRVLKLLETAEKTRYFVAKKPVVEWVECEVEW